MSAARPATRRRRLLWCGVLAALYCALPALAPPATASASGSTAVQYYYQNPCASCDEAGEFRAFLTRTAGDAAAQVQVLTYNTFQLRSEEAYRKACDQLGIPRERRALPMVAIGGRYLIGKGEIESGLRALFLDSRAAAAGDGAHAGLLWVALTGLPRGALLCAAALLLLAAVEFWPPQNRGTLLTE